MKFGKIAAVAMVLALSPLAAHAADTKTGDSKFAIGPQGGLTFPNYHVVSDSSTLGGIFMEFGVWSVVLRPEANYVQKGFTVGSVKVDNHYVEIPLLVKFNPFGDFAISPFIVLGPQWSKQVGESTSNNGTTVFTNNTHSSWDVSAVGGVGFDVNFSDHIAFELQARYSYGFHNIGDSTTNIKARDFYTIAGISFQGGL
jgi:outer membrane protein W